MLAILDGCHDKYDIWALIYRSLHYGGNLGWRSLVIWCLCFQVIGHFSIHFCLPWCQICKDLLKTWLSIKVSSTTVLQHELKLLFADHCCIPRNPFILFQLTYWPISNGIFQFQQQKHYHSYLPLDQDPQILSPPCTWLAVLMALFCCLQLLWNIPGSELWLGTKCLTTSSKSSTQQYKVATAWKMIHWKWNTKSIS